MTDAPDAVVSRQRPDCVFTGNRSLGQAVSATNVFRPRVDRHIEGRICLHSEPESEGEDAACNAAGVHIYDVNRVLRGNRKTGNAGVPPLVSSNRFAEMLTLTP